MVDRTDAVIRALTDPHRRGILDALRVKDGQSVTELRSVTPELGRHAVLKHVVVLEDAGLVTTRKVGRRRSVFLNPVPLVELARRWIDDFGAHWGLALARLRDHLDNTPGGTDMPTTETASGATPTITRITSVVIHADADRIWQALTDPDLTARWFYGTAISSSLQPETAIEYRYPDGTVALEGTVVECDPRRRLVHTFHAIWDDEVSADPPSLQAWIIEPIADGMCRVTIEHSGIVPGSATEQQAEGGRVFILSALKTLLETGSILPGAG